MKLSDLDLDIPSTQSDVIKGTLIRGSVKNDRGKRQPHPAGVYFYKSVPSFEGIAIIDYKTMEKYDYQKIDILNNTFLDNMTAEELNSYIEIIENEDIDWESLWQYEDAYQLSNYPGILREFQVSSIMDVAIVIAIIRPGTLPNYEKMKKFIHTDTILNKKSDKIKDILKETYGIAIFDEQFKKMGINDDKYRYKKPHSLGYAYVLLIDFLKNGKKKQKQKHNKQEGKND